MDRKTKVALLKKHNRDTEKAVQEQKTRGSFSWISLPSYPVECRGLKCEAKTRRGTPCKNDGTSWLNGRCKFHGGMSTGPKTLEGKANSAQNGFRPKKAEP